MMPPTDEDFVATTIRPARRAWIEPEPEPKTVTIGRGTYILLVASSAVAGFIGAALGMVAVMIW